MQTSNSSEGPSHPSESVALFPHEGARLPHMVSGLSRVLGGLIILTVIALAAAFASGGFR